VPLCDQARGRPGARRDEKGLGDVRPDEAAGAYRPLHHVLTMTKFLRKGFTLNEVMISLVILSVIGAAFTRILTYQTRYLAHETSIRTARSVARTANNILLTDLRAVQDSGGVDSVGVGGQFIRILVPYRLGLVCGTNGLVTTVSMLPVDSATIALSVYKGFAWRDSLTGR